MAYTTQPILTEEFGEEELAELLDRDNDGSEDAGALDRAIAFVDSIIDGYLRGKYSLPLTSNPAILVGVANDLVRYRLYDTKATEEVTTRYSKAMDALKAIASGTIILDVAEATRSTSEPVYSAPERIFTHDTLGDF
jgi:phage gp36-like protein